MSLLFEELDYRPTPNGAVSLRRRRQLSLGVEVFEIKLGEENRPFTQTVYLARKQQEGCVAA